MSSEGIEAILSQKIADGKIIKKIETTNLVQPGENYGGELLRLEVLTEDKDGSTDTLHIVAKKIPVDEQFQILFNVQQTFRSEIAFYEKLVPLFQKFQKDNNVQKVINCFCQLYGSRLNVSGNDTVDRDGMILMENLTKSGYRNLDRHIGFNLEEANLLITELAQLHAVPLAIKLRDPPLFQKEILPFLQNVLGGEGPLKDADKLIAEIFWESDKCAPLVPKVIKMWNSFVKNPKYEPREPFATFSHSDLWVNNIMVKHQNGKPVSVKFVDFQVYSYKSPAVDLLFFCFTSIKTEILVDYFDDILKLYYRCFTDTLRQLGCDLHEFGYTNFQKELATEAKSVLAFAFFFIIFIIFSPKGIKVETPDENTSFTLNDTKIRDEIRKHLPDAAKARLHFLVQYCAKNNWLD